MRPTRLRVLLAQRVSEQGVHPVGGGSPAGEHCWVGGNPRRVTRWDPPERAPVIWPPLSPCRGQVFTNVGARDIPRPSDYRKVELPIH
jgi:hypothetical protein